MPLAPRTLERSAQLRQAAEADVVILQRKLLPLWQLRLLRSVSRVLLYDFDDALFCRDSYSRKGSQSWTRLAHFWATIYSADAAIVGNSWLQQQASEYVDPERVHLVPTCVDPERYTVARTNVAAVQPGSPWIGLHSTLPCLYHAEPMMVAAAARLPASDCA